MAESSCDADVLWNTENSLDLPVVDSGDERKQTAEADSGSVGALCCVLCGVAVTSASCHVKLLPCLHLACQHCLLRLLRNKSLPYPAHTDFAAVIFACPCCSYSIQLPSSGVAGLKDASFLRAVNACAVVSTAGDKQASTLLVDHAVNCSADEASVKHSELSQSLLKENRSVPLLAQAGSNHNLAEMSQSFTVNGEERSNGDVCADGVTVSRDVRSQIRSLLADAERCRRDSQRVTHQLQLASQELDARQLGIEQTVSRRADQLCQLIYARRDQLLDELRRDHSHSSHVYTERLSGLAAHRRNLQHCRQVADAVLATSEVTADVEHDVVARLNHLITCDRTTTDTAHITAMRLDIPDSQHEESHLEKLFGSLVRGTVGSVELLKSFNTDLHWPSGFVVTSSHDSVLAGKAGAFASEGQVLFYDNHGTCVQRHTLPAGHLPIDVVAVRSGDVLVSDVSGQVTKFSASGGVLAQWSDVFQGASGHMAVNSSGQVLVTSAAECCIHCYCDVDGRRLGTFSLQWPSTDGLHTAPDITAIAVDCDDHIIVTASNLRSPHFFTAEGQFLHSCRAEPAADHAVRTLAGNGLKSATVALPSAMCCDAFNNVLIADFLENCVHLLSSAGSYLGRLLTKAHGIACPNFVTVDHDGRLYVGQYGGDVLVFRYLSYVKHV